MAFILIKRGEKNYRDTFEGNVWFFPSRDEANAAFKMLIKEMRRERGDDFVRDEICNPIENFDKALAEIIDTRFLRLGTKSWLTIECFDCEKAQENSDENQDIVSRMLDKTWGFY